MVRYIKKKQLNGQELAYVEVMNFHNLEEKYTVIMFNISWKLFK